MPAPPFRRCGSARFRWPAALLLLALAGCARDPERATAPGEGLRDVLPPSPGVNVLVVSFDALRADRLGTYGYPRPTSPHIDDFARDAVVIEHAWSAAQSTPTSFASMFTGRWPSQVFRGWRLDPAPTLATVFANAGYQTAFLATNVQLVASRRFGQGFYDYEILTAGPSSDRDGDNIADDLYLLARARHWLFEEARPPFLLWVHFLSPHSPYTVREGSEHLYRSPGGERFAATTGHTFDVDSEEDLERVRDLYDGEVHFADGLFASLLDALDRSGREGDTLVALTADHGEELLEHGGLQHSTVFEEVIRVPLILRHPRGGSGRSDLPASGVDLLPTLAEIAGLEAPEGIDGLSLLDPMPADRIRLSLAMTHRTDHYIGVGRGDEKLVLDCAQGNAALYDLASDPGEKSDRLAERRRSYRQLESAAREELGGDPCAVVAAAIEGVPPTAGIDAETAARLRSLGYLGGGADGGGGATGGGGGVDAGAPATGDLAGAEPPAGDPRIWADPDPIRVCDGLKLGETVLHWSLSGHDWFEIRAGKPDGALIAQVGPTGTLPVGRWVRDGMVFFAVDPEGRTLAATVVSLTTEGCPGSP